MLKHYRILCEVLGSLLLCVLLCAGCGKKADPIPPKLILPPVIADFSADSVAEGIKLSWSAPEPRGQITHFRILRSEGDFDQACPGCPQDYRPFAMLKIADQTSGSEVNNGFHYIDTTVEEGRFYSYRISACDSRGHCGDPSAPAQRLREKR